MCLKGRRGHGTLELSSCDCCTRLGMSARPRAEGRGASSRGAAAVSGCWGRESRFLQCVASGELPVLL